MDVLAEALAEQDKSFEDITVAVQGFGNVGSNAARLIAERGAKIVAVADHTGGVCAETGLDIPGLVAWVADHGGVKGFPSGEAFDGSEIITWDADVLVPAALEDAIHKDNAADVKAPDHSGHSRQRRWCHRELLRVGAEHPTVQMG
jgi:glutamate dehydrogenase/leucine dehydrogenase